MAPAAHIICVFIGAFAFSIVVAFGGGGGLALVVPNLDGVGIKNSLK